MPDFSNDDLMLPLPGLEDAPSNLPPLVVALRRSVKAMQQAEQIAEVDALDLAAMHVLARAAEMKLSTGRASTIANDLDLLLRIKTSLTTEEGETSTDEQLREAMEEFTRRLDELDQAETGQP